MVKNLKVEVSWFCFFLFLKNKQLLFSFFVEPLLPSIIQEFILLAVVAFGLSVGSAFSQEKHKDRNVELREREKKQTNKIRKTLFFFVWSWLQKEVAFSCQSSFPKADFNFQETSSVLFSFYSECFFSYCIQFLLYLVLIIS